MGHVPMEMEKGNCFILIFLNKILFEKSGEISRKAMPMHLGTGRKSSGNSMKAQRSALFYSGQL